MYLFVYSGFKSEIIGHITNYTKQLNVWLRDAGWGGKLWSPCYRMSAEGKIPSIQLLEKCFMKGPTVTVIRTDNYIYGGFVGTGYDGRFP